MPVDPLKTPGDWVVVSVETIIAWPKENFSLVFRDKNLWLLPGGNKPPGDTKLPDDKKLFHAVAIECTSEKLSRETAYELIFNFLSSMAWARRQSIEVYSRGGGSMPFRTIGRPQFLNTEVLFRGADHIQDSQGEKERLALALYREAMGLKNNAYRFLGFYKIINILFNKSKPQKEWINNNISKIENGPASERLVHLKSIGEDIGDYLYVSGRCAVAHAWNEPVANPDRFEDYRRLSQDVSIVKGLAELLIEQEFQIKSSTAIYTEHLYELDGFKKILGDDFVSRLKKKQLIPRRKLPKLPSVSLRLRGEKKFDVLEDLLVSFGEQREGMLVYNCQSKDGLFHGLFALDFPEDRLRYAFDEYVISDDGTETPLLHAASISRFRAKLLANGEFEIRATKSNKLLGRADPCIPVNIMIGPSFDNLMNIADQYEKEAERRRKSLKKKKTKKTETRK